MRLRVLVILLIFMIVPFAGASAAGRTDPAIRVGVLTNQISVLVSADTSYELLNNQGKSIGKYKAQEKVSISARNTGMAVNGVLVATDAISIQPSPANGEHYIEVNKRSYHGGIDIRRTNGKAGLTAVNTLPVEHYLYGIIAKEISPEWPLEAVKAQAVAARTYAMFNMNKHQADGFDVCATTDCQVYGGRDSEAVRASKAIDETKGLVALYRGKLIAAYFHSSAGGYTENSENVWGTSLPYLKAVPDFDIKSPHYKWERTYAPAEFEQLLRNAGYEVGKLNVLELSKLRSAPMQLQDRGISGRVKSLRITGSTGTAVITGARLRTVLGLPSTLFDIQTVLPVKNDVEFEITDSYGDRETKKVEIKVAPYPEKGLVTDKDILRRISYRPGETILISGFGWGHGIGLSQWGAKAMAEKAPAGDTEYFKTILKHYYQGIEIQKAY